MRLGRPVVVAILVAVSAITALNYALLPGQSMLDSRRVIHRRILEGTQSPPDRYRLLVPAAIEPAIVGLTPSMPREVAFDRVYGVFYAVTLALLLWSLFAYVRRWFTDEQALMGVLFVACTLPITTRLHEYAAHSFLEPTLFALALLCILDNRRDWLALLVAIAAFNRETGVFIVLLYAAARPLTRETVVTTGVFAAMWLAVFMAVRQFAGEAERYWTIDKIFTANLSNPLLTIFNLTALFGIFWWFAVAGYRRAPRFVRRTALVIPVYVAVIAVWGIWWEARLLLPMMPVLLPLALSSLFTPAPDAPAGAAMAPGR